MKNLLYRYDVYDVFNLNCEIYCYDVYEFR